MCIITVFYGCICSKIEACLFSLRSVVRAVLAGKIYEVKMTSLFQFTFAAVHINNNNTFV